MWDWLLANVGGAVHSNPEGSTVGAKLMRDTIDKYKSKKFISLENIETIKAEEKNIYWKSRIRFWCWDRFRVENNKLYLGHDKNQYLIDQNFLTKNRSKIDTCKKLVVEIFIS